MAGWKTSGVSVGAIVASLLTLGCCLPVAFLGAAGLAGASVFFASARLWLLGVSVILLGVGIFQVYRGMRCQTRQNKTAIALLSLATIIVLLVLLFPQAIASVLANLSGKP